MAPAAARSGLLLAAAVALAGAAACSYSVETEGSKQFVERWEPPGSNPHPPSPEAMPTVREVVEKLGPPSRMRVVDDRLWLIYRYRERIETSFTLSYYLQIFRRLELRGQDTELILVFGADDRLLYAALRADEPDEHTRAQRAAPRRAETPEALG